jgi:hypothetical protein
MTESSGRAPGNDEPAAESQTKDRVVQTRVPRDLESVLKREARRRRLTVSHLIRNVLEDAFALVDGVVANVDDLVTDSVELVRKVGSDARRVAGAVREAGRAPEPEPRDAGPAHVWAWNRVVLNRAADCSRCRRAMPRGTETYAGLSDDASRPREWLCGDCIAQLDEPRATEGDTQ